MGHELAFLAGLTDPNKWPYLLWSGIGGDIAKVTIPTAALLAILRQLWVHHQLAKSHHALLQKHHALLEDHHRLLLQQAIEKEVSV